MRPHYLSTVIFVCNEQITRFVGLYIPSLTVMSSALEVDDVSPTCTTQGPEVVEGNDSVLRGPSTFPEKPIESRFSACICRLKDKFKPSRSYSFKKHHNIKKRCIVAYLHFIWMDSLSLPLFGLLILGLHIIPNHRHDLPLMPIWIQDSVLANITRQDLDIRAPVEFMFPYQKSPLSDLVCAVAVHVVPIIVIALFQLRVRSLWDFYAGQLGILKAVTTT